jgi:hypothetical protein
MLSLACAVVPASGQEKAVSMTGKVENLPVLQLRADEALPDSAVVYSPTGEKKEKHVHLPGESHGKYVWENGAWIFSDTIPNTGYFSGASYDREAFNEQWVKVGFRIITKDLSVFDLPMTHFGSWYISLAGVANYDAKYDAKGNLTSYRVIYADDWWQEFTVTYNERNNPVYIEVRNADGKVVYKVNYEYNDYGYATLFDFYTWDFEKNAWISRGRETAEYDTQGKILFIATYENGEIISRDSYEYYDEIHFSSRSYIVYGNEERDGYSYRREWKYGTDGKPEAYYYYENDELSYYVIFYYGNSSSVEAVPESVARVWSSGGQLYIAGTASGAAQVYTVAGQLLKTVPFTSGQTTATPLPRGIYIVAAAGRTWKVVSE